MVFLICGSDNYRARRALAAAREQFLKKRDSSGLNVSVLKAGTAGLDSLAEAMFSSPFLSEKKLLVLEGYLRESLAEQARLKEMLDRKPDSTVVVFFEDAAGDELKKSPLYGPLAARKYSAEYAPLAPAQAVAFAAGECAAHGVPIVPRAARALVARVGADSRRIHLEAGKLAAYSAAKGLKSIPEEAVPLLVGDDREETVFAFLDACLEGRAARAAAVLENLFASGLADMQLIAMLLRQFRGLISARLLLEKGVRGGAAAASALGVHPYAAGKMMAAAGRFSFERLRALHGDLLEIDRRLKNGASKTRALFDLFALKAAESAA